MLDDFFVRALVAGCGVALVAGPLGCFVVWRRLSYFGDTLAHAALLGVAVSLLLDVDMTLSVFAVSAGVALLMLGLQRRGGLPSDALLGLLSHSALAMGLVVLGFLTWIRFDLNALLFGDILAVTRQDIALIWLGGAVVLGVLAGVWRPLLAGTVNRELAEAEGVNAARAELVFMILTAGVIAIAMKVVGVLLITALLIMPAAAARRFSTSPEQMALAAALFGVLAVVGGLFGSLNFDTPSGPSIVVAALLIFIISLIPIGRPGISNRGGA